MNKKLKSVKIGLCIYFSAVLSFLTSTAIYANSGDTLLAVINLTTTLLLAVGLISKYKEYRKLIRK